MLTNNQKQNNNKNMKITGVNSKLYTFSIVFPVIYEFEIFSEESKRRGFTAIVDSRDGSWQNLVTVLGCLKVRQWRTRRVKKYIEQFILGNNYIKK